MATTTQPRAAAPASTEAHATSAPRNTWHAGVWLVWALAAAACIELAPSPVYVALVIGIASVAVSIHARPGPYAARVPAAPRGGCVLRGGADVADGGDDPRARRRPVHDAPLRAPAAARGVHRRRHGRTAGDVAVIGRGLRHRRRDGRVRRVQLGGVALGAGRVDAPRLLRARAGDRGRTGLRAVDARGHPRRARCRSCPHGWQGRAAGTVAAPSGAGAGARPRTGGHARGVDGLAWVRARGCESS